MAIILLLRFGDGARLLTKLFAIMKAVILAKPSADKRQQCRQKAPPSQTIVVRSARGRRHKKYQIINIKEPYNEFCRISKCFENISHG